MSPSSARGSPASGRRCSSRRSSPALEVAVVEQGLAALRRERTERRHAVRDGGPRPRPRDRALRRGRGALAGAAWARRNVAEMTAFLADARHPVRLRADRAADGGAHAGARGGGAAHGRRRRAQLGLDSFHLLDAEAVQAEVHSPLYLGGVAGHGRRDPRSGQAGGRPSGGGRAAGRAGVRAEPRDGARAAPARARGSEPQRGAVDGAPALVLATSAYTHHLLPAVTRRFIPLYDYILVSDPLTPDAARRDRLARRQGVTDGRTFFNYYRLTADDRILWGTSEATYYAGQSGRSRRATTRRRTTRRSARASAGTSRRSRASSFRMPGAAPICSTTRMTPYLRARAWAAGCATAWATRATASARPDSPAGSWRTWRWTARASCWICRW